MGMPVAFRNFTDFFASIFHATNAGRLFWVCRGWARVPAGANVDFISVSTN
jgi:hypothetical protein